MNSNKESMLKTVWAGLIGIKAKPDIDFFDEGIKGAYVNILAWASNAEDYRKEISLALDHYGLFLTSIENVEPLSEWIKKNPEIDNDLLRLSEEVKKTGNVRFGTFHEYEEE